MRLYKAQITIKAKDGTTQSKLKPEFILLENQENIFESLNLLYNDAVFDLVDYDVREVTVYKSKKVFDLQSK